jgi:phosphate-selective porin OprO/OprP
MMASFTKQATAAWVVLCVTAGLGWGQDQASSNDVKALRALVEQQQKQIDELTKHLGAPRVALGVPTAVSATDPGGTTAPALNAQTVKQMIADQLKELAPKGDKPDAEASKADKEAERRLKLATEGYRVGSDLKITAEFKDGFYLWLRTPNDDFTMHPGYWMQYDNTFWGQSGPLKTPPGGRPGPPQKVASGALLGGIGDLQDGSYFRRIRPYVEGTFWENYEYRLITLFDNVQFGQVGLDEFWVAANHVPLLGTVRVGHIKTPMGFEADMTGSSRTMTFMERSSYSESIEMNQNFVTGLLLSNNYLDQRTTWTFAAFRQDIGATTGDYFGDGQYGMQGRITALPIFECDGRHLLHLGFSTGWRNNTNNTAVSPLRTIQLRARPELRDDDGAASPAGAPALPNANSNRLVDTGVIAATNDWVMGTELFYVNGPLTVQGEYGWNTVDNVTGFAPAGSVLTPKLSTPANYVFSGGYIQVAYTLTGENRAYDKKYGILSRYYYGEKGPFTPAWFVRDENGRLNWGWGAWELAARYSYVNLNDGNGANRIQGGVMEGVTLGVNWYLNSNLLCQFNYVYDHRFDLPVGSIPGNVSGLGMRVMLSF